MVEKGLLRANVGIVAKRVTSAQSVLTRASPSPVKVLLMSRAMAVERRGMPRMIAGRRILRKLLNASKIFRRRRKPLEAVLKSCLLVLNNLVMTMRLRKLIGALLLGSRRGASKEIALPSWIFYWPDC